MDFEALLLEFLSGGNVVVLLLAVFLVVAVLVYGSFVIAESGGGVKYASPQADIQTGGRPPF